MDLKQFNQAGAAGDHFSQLGIPHQFDVDPDLLKRNYLALARQTHPDFFAGSPDQLPDALTAAAAIHGAYRTLSDPVARAEYLLLRHGGKDSAADKRVPPEMLTDVLEIREDMLDATAAGDQARLAAIRQRMLQQEAHILETISGLARRLTATREPAATGDPATLDALRVQLNAMKYVKNILEQL